MHYNSFLIIKPKKLIHITNRIISLCLNTIDQVVN